MADVRQPRPAQSFRNGQTLKPDPAESPANREQPTELLAALEGNAVAIRDDLAGDLRGRLDDKL